MANPFELIVELKQHTPIIHFQHEQMGATLRATEVKAKLDKYIIQHEFANDASGLKPFLVDPNKPLSSALNYKLQIRILEKGKENERLYLLPESKRMERGKEYPMFFGNMGTEYKTGDRTAIFDKRLLVSIHSFKKELLTRINLHLSNFFASTNFGMRSTKGYGSFSVIGVKPTIKPRFSFMVDTNNWRTAFQYVDLFYKTVRSGLNGASLPGGGFIKKGFYMKPLIFLYANDNKIKWEKRAIKEDATNLFPLHQKEQDYGWKVKHRDLGKQEDTVSEASGIQDIENWPLWQQHPNSRIVRDILGLSSDQQWMGYGQRSRSGYSADIKKYPKKENEEIERLASPFIFKPICIDDKFRIDVFVRTIPKEFLQAIFKISVDDVEIEEDYPVWSNFDMENFINNYLTLSKLSSAITCDPQQDNRVNRIKSILENIYRQINPK